MKKYSFKTIIFACVFLCVFMVINLIVDPYWIYGSAEIKSFNSSKPAAADNSRLFEVANVLRSPPEALIIGTSREDSGIDPKHVVFQNHSVFNAAIPSQPFVESKEILQSLSMHEAFPKQIIFGLLFENANIFGYSLPADYSKENFNSSRPYELLLSISTLKSSANTVATNLVGKPLLAVKDGFRTPDKWLDQLLIGQRRAFKDNERHYLFDNHFPLPACKSALVAESGNDRLLTPMQQVRDTVVIAYRMKSDMRLFIGPSHARQWETIYASGLWGQFEDWKRMLVDIVESEAKNAKATPFQVWDFSGYNSITEEYVPGANEITKRMTYYYESSHYTPAAGDLVLDRMFNYKSPTRRVPDDFGVLLTSNNIDAHLASIRMERENYRKTHPEDVTEIETMAKEVIKAKHCHNAKNVVITN